MCLYSMLAITAVVFRVYDVDRDGYISKDDLLMVRTYVRMYVRRWRSHCGGCGVGTLAMGTCMVSAAYESHFTARMPSEGEGIHTVPVK